MRTNSSTPISTIAANTYHSLMSPRSPRMPRLALGSVVCRSTFQPPIGSIALGIDCRPSSPLVQSLACSTMKKTICANASVSSAK